MPFCVPISEALPVKSFFFFDNSKIGLANDDQQSKHSEQKTWQRNQWNPLKEPARNVCVRVHVCYCASPWVWPVCWHASPACHLHVIYRHSLQQKQNKLIINNNQSKFSERPFIGSWTLINCMRTGTGIKTFCVPPKEYSTPITNRWCYTNIGIFSCWKYIAVSGNS